MAKKNLKSASFDLNMSVSVAANLSDSQAYWCIPGLHTDETGKSKLCSYIWKDVVGFSLPEKLKIVLSYPLDREYIEELNLIHEYKRKNRDGTEEIERYRKDTIGDIVYAAAQAYKRAYQEIKEGKNGAWHSLGDLVFEGMTVYEDGKVEFFVGS